MDTLNKKRCPLEMAKSQEEGKIPEEEVAVPSEVSGSSLKRDLLLLRLTCTGT